MSTILVDTTGGSKFLTSTDLVDANTPLGATIKSNKFLSSNVALTNTDKMPQLVPVRQVIDVVNDFSWYAGPKATTEALAKVPCAFLVEREQLLSSLVSGALYYLNASSKTFDAFAQSAAVTSLLGKLAPSARGIANEARDFAGTLNSGLQGIAGGTGSDKELLKNHNLKSLEGIYFTKETGFNYRLPIFGSPTTPTGSWDGGSNGTGGVTLQGLVSKAQGVVDTISNAVNFAQPGTYIEKPQYFRGASGRTESITFPLVNTVRRGTHSPVQQNYEFLWLLAFANKPYKTSFSRTPPPKIYSVNVPGQFSMPYAFISGMDVSFMGTTRNAKVFVPAGSGEGNINSKQITTPVPEAYQVTLTFTSLIGDYGNTMLSDAFTTSITNNKVTIGGSK
jgi:hypothetical protein